METNYYTYAWLRIDGTPYYIGKGKGNRAYYGRRHGYKAPKDRSRILILKKNLTEKEAHQHERYMIAIFGRKDLETGILRNRTDGGEGTSGWVMPKEVKDKIGQSNTGKTSWMRGKPAHNKGIPAKQETREKCGQVNRGKKASKETKQKMSNAKKGKLLSPQCYEARKTPVLGTDPEGEIFYYESATEAGRATGIDRKKISSCCRGETESAGTWTWVFFK